MAPALAIAFLTYALVARHHYRHTTITQPFRTVFWLAVVASCAAFAGLVVVEPLSLL